MKKTFKVGQKVTYKSRKDCTDNNGFTDYYFGGVDKVGQIHPILEYVEPISKEGCWKIRVEAGISGTYTMLESEFKEFHLQSKKRRRRIAG